jgi:hypothetical protein
MYLLGGESVKVKGFLVYLIRWTRPIQQTYAVRLRPFLSGVSFVLPHDHHWYLAVSCFDSWSKEGFDGLISTSVMRSQKFSSFDFG